MTVTLKNNTGIDIKDCSILLGNGGKKHLSWFEDGDVIQIPFQVVPPSIVGYQVDEEDDEETLVEGEARPLAKVGVTVVKWVINKVHEVDD